MASSASAESSSQSVLEDVAANVITVQHRIVDAATAASRSDIPRLVAVSKTKPMSHVLAAYNAGQRIFGENYVQELVDKDASPELPEDLVWHFIGHLQSNKVNHIAGVKNLGMVETISSAKLARKLNQALENAGRQEPVEVMVQVNTSDEEKKNGVPPEEAFELCSIVRDECSRLKLRGLMTIGMLGRKLADGETNPDFEKLAETRNEVASRLGLSPDELELSMGMSSDFEHAIALGSTNVRVGSTIFGPRSYPKKET